MDGSRSVWNRFFSLIFRVRKFYINDAALEQVLTSPGGMVHESTYALAQRMADQINYEAPVYKGYLSKGASVSPEAATGRGKNVSFLITVSSVYGGADREYAYYVQEGINPRAQVSPNPFVDRALRKIRSAL